MSGLMRLSKVGPMLVKKARLSYRAANGNQAVMKAHNFGYEGFFKPMGLNKGSGLGGRCPAQKSSRVASAFAPHCTCRIRTYLRTSQHEPRYMVGPLGVSAPEGSVEAANCTVSACPLTSAAYSGSAEFSGREAEGMVMFGGVLPSTTGSGCRRMKPLSSELLMSTAAAWAAWAFTTCNQAWKTRIAAK